MPGHIGVFIVGDYTTRIGDPSGRSAERPILSPEEIDANAKTYVEQAFTIVDREKTEVRFNSEWLAGLDFADVIRLTRTTTVAQILERDDFSKRMGAREPISVSELLYPLMQAYDSVAIEADVELGGTDQLYNLLAGRMVMEAYGLEPQVVLTTPLLLSWDGEKMSSSVGNNIPLTAPAEEQFGRTMRIPDSQLEEWYRLVLERDVPAGEPMEAKLALARAIAARSHGADAADAAAAHFTRVVREGQAPDEVPDAALPAGRSRPSARASGLSLRPLDERGAPSDLPGRRQAERRRRRPSSISRATRWSERRSRQASAASPGCAKPVDSAGVSATVPRPPERVGVAKSPSSTQPERLQASIGYDQHRKLWRPLARVGGFFTPPPERGTGL